MIKNKKYLLASLIFGFMPFLGVNAQVKTFETVFSSSANDLGNFVQQTQDGGYILCGAKGVPGTIGYYDFSLIKISASGTVQWSKSIGDSLYDEQAQSIRAMNDGTYIVYGSRSSTSGSSAWLIKTDEAGNKKWAVEQQGSHSSRFGYSMVPAADGGFQTASYDNGTSDSDYFQLQKTDPSGAVLFGPKNIVKGLGINSSLALTKDGNYIAVGTTAVAYNSANGNYYSTITLAKLNNTCTTLWSRTYKVTAGTNTSNYLQGFGVQATSDGGYIVCGTTNVNTRGGTDIFLLKTNANGDSLWSKTYGGSANDAGLSVKEIPGGGYVISGNTRSFGSGSSDIFILKTSVVGDSLWMRTFGGTGTETSGNIEVTSDSGFVVIGTTTSYGGGQNNMLLLRTDSQGRIPDASVNWPGITKNICSTGGSVTLNALPGYTYKWSTNATTQSITVNSGGNYSVTVKDNYNNSNTSKAINVALDNPISYASITADGPLSFCTGNVVNFMGDSAAGYVWQWQANGADITGAIGRRYAATEDGDYNVVTSNACSSIKSSSMSVNVMPVPTVPTITPSGKNLVSSSSSRNQWFRNGISIPGAVNPTFTPTQNGIYTVVVNNENNCTSVSQPFNISTVGIEENNAMTSYLVFPNPAADLVYVDYNVSSSSANYFVIYNGQGKEVYREKLNNETGLLKINSSDLASGIYFSAVESQGALMARKALAVIHR